ncbi:MAG TPA: septum formation initiator family protein [Candidatus Paceibacterota bacterium]|nr:septum formation initiator family protein [Candidatus Paceibacterota bacterium]
MRRRAARTRLKEYAIAGLLALAIVWLLWLVWGIARKEEIARQAVKETAAELAALEERQMTLEANLAELSTDRGEEATVRQTYGVARPGEEVIIVVPPKDEPEDIQLPWYKKFLGWFGIW